MVILLAARAARIENQDAIDAAIVNMLGYPKEVDSKTRFTEFHYSPLHLSTMIHKEEDTFVKLNLASATGTS